MSTKRVQCKGCGKRVYLTDAQGHGVACGCHELCTRPKRKNPPAGSAGRWQGKLKRRKKPEGASAWWWLLALPLIPP